MSEFSLPVTREVVGHSHASHDEELVRQSQSGCTECLSLLFRRYHRLVLTIGWRVLRQQCEAEDIVQEVFLSILAQHNPYVQKRSSVKTWICQIAYFKALMRRRNLATRKLTVLDEAICSGELDALARFQRQNPERIRLVRECLGALHPRQRRTIELVFFEGYTLLEAASVLKESLANTRNQYYRGMKALRTHLFFPHATAGFSPISQKRPDSPDMSEPVPNAET